MAATIYCPSANNKILAQRRSPKGHWALSAPNVTYMKKLWPSLSHTVRSIFRFLDMTLRILCSNWGRPIFSAKNSNHSEADVLNTPPSLRVQVVFYETLPWWWNRRTHKYIYIHGISIKHNTQLWEQKLKKYIAPETSPLEYSLCWEFICIGPHVVGFRAAHTKQLPMKWFCAYS